MGISDRLRKRSAKRPSQGVVPYDFFIIAITLLSFVNLLLIIVIKNDTLQFTIGIIDLILSALFFIDFLRLFLTAEKKSRYFFKEFGWADLIASFPFPQLKLFRIFRLIIINRSISKAGFKGIRNGFDEDKASAAILLVAFIIILLLEFGSVGILILEAKSPESNIKTASDAIWWVYVSITTVGYGDRYPVTNGGRLFATVVMLVGVGLFGVVTGFLANKFVPKSKDAEVASKDDNDAKIDALHEELHEIRALLEKVTDDAQRK